MGRQEIVHVASSIESFPRHVESRHTAYTQEQRPVEIVPQFYMT